MLILPPKKIVKPAAQSLIRPSRRGFVAGAAAALCAPSVVRAGSLSLLGVGKPSGGAGPIVPAWVQGNITQNGNTGLNYCDVTLASPVGNGNMLIVSVGWLSTTSTFTVTDDKGNTYTQIQRVTGGGYGWSMFYCLNITNAPTVISGNNSIFDTYGMTMVDEFSGVLASGALDGSNMSNNVAGVNTTDGVTSGNFTTTANGDLICGNCVNISGGGTLVKGTGFSQAQVFGADFNTEYRIQASAGSVSATYTGTTSGAFSTGGAAFKHA